MNRQKQVGAAPTCSLLLIAAMIWAAVNMPSRASAQITPDNTLPVNSSVSGTCAMSCTINGGTIRGSNWFHSFSQFSVPTSGEAFFNNSPSIQNIITRITGNSISAIDGKLSANGTASLFLINPNGIVFGPNAQLNLGGSFIASTANSLRFADGTEFSAVNPSPSALLTLSVPLGLQYGSNPARIEVQGPGNNLYVADLPFEIVRNDRPSGLQVQPGQTLALVGGDLLLQGGNLTAEGGRVELGSVAGGTVTLISTNPGWALNYQGIQSLKDIRLTQAASVDTSSDSGGVIQVQGRTLSLTGGSSLLALTTGTGTGGLLNIRTTDSVEVSGILIDPVYGPSFPSSLLTEVALGATGRGGDLRITTGQLLVTDGAKVSVSTSGPGSGGNLQIQAQTVELARSSPFFGASQLAADVSNPDSGQGGNITVNANRVLLDGGGWITANTSGVGNAGTIQVNAEAIAVTGGTDDLVGLIGTQVNEGSSGNGGSIRLNTNRLQVLDGGQVSTSTFGFGNAGRLEIFAQDVEVTAGASERLTGLFSAVEMGASGKGGNLEITTGSLRIANGGQVAADTLGDGNAGNLIVNARTVELTGFNQQGRSGLFAGAIIGSGAGGDVSVTADRLTLRDGATISVSNFSSRNPSIPVGQGPAGNAQVNARVIELDNASALTAASAGGDKGNIFLNSQILLLRRDSSISTNALGNATGGNISINTDFIVAVKDENSDITANAVNNFGGRISINAKGIFGIQFRSKLTPFSDITASSDLGVQFNGIVEIHTPDTDPTQGLSQLSNGLVDGSSQIASACEQSQGNTFLITGRGGLPEDASQPLRGGFVWSDLRLGAPLTQSNQSARILVSPAVDQSAVSTAIVEAQGWVKDADGQIALVAHTHQSMVGTWEKSIECYPSASTIPNSNVNRSTRLPQVSSTESGKQ